MPVVARKMGQVVGFFVLVGAVFLALSVSSYSPDDPAWNYYTSHRTSFVQNRGGTVGAVLADWGIQAFGSTVLCLAGISGLGAWCLMRGHLKRAFTVAWRGLVFFVTISGAVYLLFTRDPLFSATPIAGGIGGKWLADLAVFYLSRPGAYLGLSALAITALCVGVRWPFLVALWQGMRAIGRGSCVFSGYVSAGAKDVGRAVWEQGDVARRRVGRLADWARLDALRRVSEASLSAPPLAEAESPEPRVEESPVLRRGLIAEAEAASDPGTDHKARPAPDVEDARASLDQEADNTLPQLPKESPEPVRPLAPPVKVRRPLLRAPSLPAPPLEGTGAGHSTMPVPRQVEKASSDPRPAASAPEGAVPVALDRQATPTRGLRPQSPVDMARLPSLDLLDAPMATQRGQSPEELDVEARFLEQKLREFGVDGEVVQVLPGPVITMFEFAPAAGVKVNKIVNLQDDLALVMRALSVRVVAPIPGKAVVGIEVPHKRRETVRFRELLDSEEFRGASSKLTLALGKDILGRPVVTDLALIPHLLIAGATGSGKSVGLNSLICSLLFRATPADVKMIMIDPKMLEFSVYDGVPHLLVPVVTDPKKAAVVLRRVVEEMTRRYQLLAAKGVRSIAQYNQTLEEEWRGEDTAPERGDWHERVQTPRLAEKLPYLVVVIDELSDLMMVSAREVEDSLMRLAQMARAAGIHLIVATQRPSVDVLTGVIKANFPARLSFQVTSKVDSRTILDMNGAETLLGRGDMLFLAPGTSKPQRVHGAYVSEAEISRLVAEWKSLAEPQYDDSFYQPMGQNVDVEDDEYDEKYDEAVALVTKTAQASISMLQRRLRVGYNRAARMIEMMEKEGVVGPADGIKPREVLVRHTFEDE